MQEIMVLILEIILLMLKAGISKEEATRATASKFGMDFSELWEAVNKH